MKVENILKRRTSVVKSGLTHCFILAKIDLHLWGYYLSWRANYSMTILLYNKLNCTEGKILADAVVRKSCKKLLARLRKVFRKTTTFSVLDVSLAHSFKGYSILSVYNR